MKGREIRHHSLFFPLSPLANEANSSYSCQSHTDVHEGARCSRFRSACACIYCTCAQWLNTLIIERGSCRKAHGERLMQESSWLQLGCLYKKRWNEPHRPQAGIGFGYLTLLGPDEEELNVETTIYERIHKLLHPSLIVLKAKEVLSLHRNIWGFHVSREVGRVIHSLRKEHNWKILGRLLKREKDWRNI